MHASKVVMTVFQYSFVTDEDVIHIETCLRSRVLGSLSVIDSPSLDVTSIQFNAHTGITGFANNDFDISGRDRVECVQNWSEMITVPSKGLRRK